MQLSKDELDMIHSQFKEFSPEGLDRLAAAMAIKDDDLSPLDRLRADLGRMSIHATTMERNFDSALKQLDEAEDALRLEMRRGDNFFWSGLAIGLIVGSIVTYLFR